MKKLIYLLLFFPLLATAQINGTIQKTVATGIVRGSFGSSGIDTLPPVTGVLTNGYILKYNSTLKKWYASPDISFATFGSTPNANGASVSSGVITLQPASASFPGGVTTGAQTFAGDKAYTGTVNSSVYISALSSGRGWIMNAGVVPSLVSYSNYGANSYIDWVKGGTAKWRVGFNGTNSDYSIRNSTNATNVLVVDTLNNITLSSLTNGLVKSTSGTLSNATAGTDYLTPTGSGTGLSGIVLKAGDTMTGNLLAPSILLTPASSNNGLSINRSGLNASPISINETGGSSNASIEISNTGNTASGGVESIFSGTSQNGIGFKVTGNSTYAGDPFRYVKNGSTLFNVSNTGGITGVSAILTDALSIKKTTPAGFSTNLSFQNSAGVNRWLTGVVTAETGSGNTGTDLAIYAYNDDGSLSGLTHAMKMTRATRAVDFSGAVSAASLTSAGDVIINSGGNLSVGYASGQASRLSVNGSTVMDGSVIITSLGTGTVYSNASTLTNTNPSDSTLKNTITPLKYGLSEVLKLQPKTFYYNSDSTKSSLKYGFIAQEVQPIMPDIVRKISKDSDKLGLESDGIYVTLVKAIQEQQAIITALEARIKALELKP